MRPLFKASIQSARKPSGIGSAVVTLTMLGQELELPGDQGLAMGPDALGESLGPGPAVRRPAGPRAAGPCRHGLPAARPTASCSTSPSFRRRGIVAPPWLRVSPSIPG